MMDGVSIMGKEIGLPVGNTIVQVLIHKDNAGAPKLYHLNSILEQALPCKNYLVLRIDCVVWDWVI